MYFEEICEKYRTWVIQISSIQLLRPVFVIWLTDTTDEDKDKLIINNEKKIIASDNFNGLLEYTLKIKSTIPNPMNTLTWLYNVQGLECTSTKYELESIEESIQSNSFNKKSIIEAVNFINLCRDFELQTANQEMKTIRKGAHIKKLWEYGYNEFFWKEFESKTNLEAVNISKFGIDNKLLNMEMSQLISVFLSRLEVTER